MTKFGTKWFYVLSFAVMITACGGEADNGAVSAASASSVSASSPAPTMTAMQRAEFEQAQQQLVLLLRWYYNRFQKRSIPLMDGNGDESNLLIWYRSLKDNEGELMAIEVSHPDAHMLKELIHKKLTTELMLIEMLRGSDKASLQATERAYIYDSHRLAGYILSLMQRYDADWQMSQILFVNDPIEMKQIPIYPENRDGKFLPQEGYEQAAVELEKLFLWLRNWQLVKQEGLDLRVTFSKFSQNSHDITIFWIYEINALKILRPRLMAIDATQADSQQFKNLLLQAADKWLIYNEKSYQVSNESLDMEQRRVIAADMYERGLSSEATDSSQAVMEFQRKLLDSEMLPKYRLHPFHKMVDNYFY